MEEITAIIESHTNGQNSQMNEQIDEMGDYFFTMELSGQERDGVITKDTMIAIMQKRLMYGSLKNPRIKEPN